jgi:lipoprotein signal peptidase
MPDITFEVSRQWFFWASLLALVVGILILIRPQLLSYLVAAYLILAGGLGLAPYAQRWLNL